MCIQCDFKDCRRAFHIRCAMNKKLIKAWDKMNEDQRAKEEDESCFIFCGGH